ncbi:sporulation protein YpjB [Paenibacillus filicis]|uniref:Sporulation protein YpjB n=1 Tax=Paenibacillus gyeongsangnamensis TaxID=3388067 RepID=A0ABT4Q7X1_9BACL|nr:sporulation protein YpjB [Paenibacillus filicis]MCZ8512967.1 sporulation protein YpjB [Paenibacillus filicis]
MRLLKKSKWMWVGIMLAAVPLILFGCAQSAKERAASAPKPTQEQLQKVELLNRTADDMYKRVTQGDVSGGREVLKQLNDQLPKIQFEGITTADGIRALTNVLNDATRTFNAVKFNPNEGQLNAVRLRLATDALTHASQPMWLQYYKQLSDDISKLEKSAKAKNKADLRKAAGDLSLHYSIVHPSLLISRSATDVEKMDSLTAFVKGQAEGSEDPFKNVLNAVPHLVQILDKLFMKKETTAYLPYADQQNPILWTLVLGSIIMSALSFAGWRLSKKDDGVVTIRRSEDA